MQLDDAAHDAGEHEPVVGLDDFGRADGRDDFAAAIDFDEEQSRQAAQAARFDASADQSATGLHQHVGHVLAARFAELLEQLLALGQQLVTDRQQVGDADDRVGHAHLADLEQRHAVVDARVGALQHQAVHDEVG